MNLPPRPASLVTPRRRYRAVALRMARETPAIGLPETPFLAAQVTLTAVANALAVSRSALYKLWDSQYDFWVDLTRYLAYDLDFSQDDHEMPWQEARRIAPDLPHLTLREADDAFRTRGEVAQRLVLADTRVLIRAASLGYGDIADVGTIRQAVEARRLHQLSTDIASTLAILGRIPTTAACELDIAAMVWSVGDELSVMAHFTPEVAEPVVVDLGGGPAPWSLLAIAARALYLGLSAPGHGDPTPRLPPSPPTVPRPSDLWSDRHLTALAVAGDLFVDAIRSPSPDLDLSGEGPSALGHVTIARVARAAGVSRRTIYNVWPTRRAMMADLFEDLLCEHVDSILAAAVRHLDSTADGAANGRRLALLTDALVGPPDTAAPPQPWLAPMIEPHDETVRHAMQRMHRRCVAQTAVHLDAWMAARKRHPVPGLSTEVLALLWLCLVRGGHRLRRSSPGFSNAFGAAAETCFDQLTLPT